MKTAPLAIILLAFAASCSDKATDKPPATPATPVAPRPLNEECDDLFKVVKEQQEGIKNEMQRPPANVRVEEIDRISAKLKSAGQAIGAAPVTAPSLVAPRDRYAKLLAEGADDVDALGGALRAGDANRVSNALATVGEFMVKASTERQQIVGDMNTACKNAPTPAAPGSATPATQAPPKP